jgi:quinol monooxygenase YgiN
MIIVQGYAQLQPGEFDRLMPELQAMVAATNAEEGCLLYNFARDVADPDILRISERWRDQAALDAHFATPHMATFNQAIAGAKVLDISVHAYDATNQRVLVGR